VLHYSGGQAKQGEAKGNEKIPGVKWVAATTSPSTPASSGAVLSVSANTYNLAGLWSEGHIHRRVGTCGGEAKELSVKI